jgi:hypothetical protein
MPDIEWAGMGEIGTNFRKFRSPGPNGGRYSGNWSAACVKRLTKWKWAEILIFSGNQGTLTPGSDIELKSGSIRWRLETTGQ